MWPKTVVYSHVKSRLLVLIFKGFSMDEFQGGVFGQA